MLRLTLAFCLAMFVPVACLFAQSTPPSTDALKRLEDRVTQLELELARQQIRNPSEVPADPKAQKVHILLETPQVGHAYTGGPNGGRFFAGKLLLINLTSQALLIKRDQLKLQVDGQPHAPKDVPENLKYQGLQIGKQHLQLESLSSFKELRIPAGATGTGWVFFPDLSPGGRVPHLVLELSIGERVEKIDINAQQRSVLGLEVTYMGPRNCLALFTISGELNMINLGSLVDELERLPAKKIGRLVLAWTETAAPLSIELHSWLEQWANSMGRNEFNTDNFPPVPATLREVHLARMPRHDQSPGEDNAELEGFKRVYKSESEAVRAALKTACETLPRDDLIAAIETGHPWSRAAVLAYGAGRLPADKLPLVLKYADDADPAIQMAALMGLRHFGEQQAIAKLLEYVRKNVEPQSSVAIASLAGSRFPAANEALLEVVKTEPAASKKSIVSVLAEYPRPIWSELLYEFAKGPDSGLNAEALRGLQHVGHPQLAALLIETLKGNNESLRQLAFEILVSRTDRESEQVAVNYTLEHLQTGAPTPQMLTLLTRVKDQRSVPPLLAAMARGEDKDAVLDALIQIGDQSLAEKLLPLYASMPVSARAKVLMTLRKWDQVKFRELSQAALLSSESALLAAAIQGLVEDGSPEAIRMLGEALDKNPEADSYAYLCNALGQLGTDLARTALLKARENDDVRKRDVAIAGLRQIYQRSPGIQECYQGKEKLRESKFDEAVSFFNQAIKKDPYLPLAYLGRGDCEKARGKLEDAGKGYEKAYELDPYSGDTITSLCILRVMQGQVKEGLERLEDEMKKSRYFRQDEGNFYYNAACAYGRGVEYLELHSDFPDRDQLKAKYAATATRYLKSSIKKGFSDFDHMSMDPDLKPLKDNPEFIRILEKREGIADEEPEEVVKPG